MLPISLSHHSRILIYPAPLMHELILSEPPPNVDSFAPEFCLCGKKTVESHEFWFCSTECARLDSLRSLDDPECHYRSFVRKGYAQAGIPELHTRRTMSVDQLHPDSPGHRGIANAPSRVLPPTSPSLQRSATYTHGHTRNLNTAGFPTLSQVTGKVLTKTVTEREPPVAERHDRSRLQGFPNAPSRSNPVQNPRDHTFEQISLDAVPFPEYAAARSLRHVPPSSYRPKANIKKSIATLLSRKGEKPEKVFGHGVNIVTPPVRKESLPSHRQISPLPTIPEQRTTTLRRSASFAGWYRNPRGGRSNEPDTVMQVVQELREGCSESFDPRSLFDLEEAD